MKMLAFLLILASPALAAGPSDCRVASVVLYAATGYPSAAYPAGYLRLVAVPRNARGEALNTWLCPDQQNPTWHMEQGDTGLRLDGAVNWDVTLDPFGHDIIIRGENLRPGTHWVDATFIQAWHGPGLSSPPDVAPAGYALRVGRRNVAVR